MRTAHHCAPKGRPGRGSGCVPVWPNSSLTTPLCEPVLACPTCRSPACKPGLPQLLLRTNAQRVRALFPANMGACLSWTAHYAARILTPTGNTARILARSGTISREAHGGGSSRAWWRATAMQLAEHVSRGVVCAFEPREAPGTLSQQGATCAAVIGELAWNMMLETYEVRLHLSAARNTAKGGQSADG